ncbi:MAG: glycoside hydrolase family 88 protein [Bacteroidaceae bacterium]|nr:glycoside hydrolase family 88 protein [Bacteroidaceae bacterium]
MKRIVFLCVLMATSLLLCAQPNWREVMEAMERANAHFMAKYPDPGKPTFVKKERPSNLWTRGVYFEGLMALTELEYLTKGAMYEPYRKYIRDWGEAHKWTPRNGVTTRDADDYCCCQTYLDMYMHELGVNLKGVDWKSDVSGEKSAKAHADFLVDHADMVVPTVECMDNVIAAHGTPWVAGGQTKSEGSNGDWTWIDAIQMGLPVLSKLTRLYHFEGDTNASRYAIQGWAMYETSRNEIGGGLLNVEDSLWWRDKDFVPPYTEPNGEDCYWSRGNGWVYAALVRAMDAMLVAKGTKEPQCWEPLGTKKWRNIGEDAHFYDYKNDYLAMTEALVKCQRKDGFWNVSLHDESNYGGVELSGTALFIYGMAWGVRHGYLPKNKYAPIIYRTWEAMVKTCLHDDGFLGYVQGTGKEPKDSQPVTWDKEPDFDDYGLGCFLLCGTEVVRLLNR